jgi:hypothetical protein
MQSYGLKSHATARTHIRKMLAASPTPPKGSEMGEKMSLGEVRKAIDRFRDWRIQHINRNPSINDLLAWMDAIDANLATPAQTVDVEAVREVIAQLKDFGFAETKDMDKWSDKLSQAIGGKA